MVISPPLVFEKTHVDELLDKARLCLDQTAAGLGMQ